MDESSRYYLFAHDGVKRLSHRILEGLIHGKDAMPQYANTKQRVANVRIELEDGRPTKIVDATGSFFQFDADGRIREGLQRSAIQAMETFEGVRRANAQTGPVVDLGPTLDRKRWEEENRWTVSKEDLDLVAADIWRRGKSDAPKIKPAKGVAAKRHPLTFEAREAMREISSALATIDFKLNCLSEPALKGLASEARRLAEADSRDPVMMGIAEAADRRREILARHRTGRGGDWYAVIEATTWESPLRSHGAGHTLEERKCASKAEAEKVARELLAKSARYFSDSTTIEASVFCDLEWEPETGRIQEYP